MAVQLQARTGRGTPEGGGRPDRQRYLKKKPLAEALETFLGATAAASARAESVAVEDALGRVTAQPVFARLSVPHYHGAAMDGIAVRAEDTFGASESTPFIFRLTARKKTGPHPERGARPFRYVDTGSPLPAWADAVVMIERVYQRDGREVEIREAAPPWQHVRLVGEDIVATEMLLPRGHRIRPYDI